MIRNLKFLGLALVAVMAMSAMIASAASAADLFTSEKVNTTLTGSQEKHLEGGVEKFDRFTTDGGIVECTGATYKGTQAATTASTVTVTPTYSGCTFTGLAATIKTNECTYVFSLIGATTTGEVEIKCPTGKEITVEVGPESTRRCIIHVPAQKLGGITYTNIGAGTTREVTVAVNTGTTLKYSETAGTGSGACATADNTTTGKYIGAAKVTGENAAGTEHFGVFLA
jgi:hypothetical protein